jgi:hypothetical protein
MGSTAAARRAGPIAAITLTLTGRLFPNEDPIGRTVLIGDARAGQQVQVVGIVPDMRLYDARNPNTAALYIPLTQEKESALYSRLLVRTLEGPTMIAGIRDVVRALGREQIIYAGPLNELRERPCCKSVWRRCPAHVSVRSRCSWRRCGFVRAGGMQRRPAHERDWHSRGLRSAAFTGARDDCARRWLWLQIEDIDA